MGFWTDFLNSFKDGKEGFSERKTTAFWLIILTTIHLFVIDILCSLRVLRVIQIMDTTLAIVLDTMSYVLIVLLIADAFWGGMLTLTWLQEMFQIYKGTTSTTETKATTLSESTTIIETPEQPKS